MVQTGAVKLQYISTNEEIVDFLTKPLSRMEFAYFVEKLGPVKISSLIVRECIGLLGPHPSSELI